MYLIIYGGSAMAIAVILLLLFFEIKNIILRLSFWLHSVTYPCEATKKYVLIICEVEHF